MPYNPTPLFKPGSRVQTPDGPGLVIHFDPVDGTYAIVLDSPLPEGHSFFGTLPVAVYDTYGPVLDRSPKGGIWVVEKYLSHGPAEKEA